MHPESGFRVCLINISYWSKFHANIMTGYGFMTIFVYKGLTWNPEIGITPVWVFLNIWRLGRVRDTKFGTNVSNKKLLNTAKCQGYNFYRFWVIKKKPTGAVKSPSPHPPRLVLKKAIIIILKVLFLSKRC